MTATASSRLPFAVPPVCFGTSPLGSMPDTYGYAVSEERARATLQAILDLPVPFIDTSRNYGLGRSEERVGAAIRARGGLPAGALLSTKLDRGFEDNRFDGDRARRSLDESLSALGVDRVDILHLHDPEYCRDLDEVTRRGGAIDALFRMKEEGLTRSVGLAMGRLSLMRDLLARWEFDAVISHNRYTLLNREADALFSELHAKGIAILNAAPYAGGVLAKGAAEMPRITYQQADAAALDPVRRIETVCARHGVATGAAALQFSTGDPRIASTICGVSRPERVTETLAWAAAEIPAACWQELKALPYATDDPEASREYRIC